MKTREELKDKIDRREPFVLIETLAPEHFRHAHLPGAVNMPPGDVEALAPTLAPDKQTEVVTYCAGSKCHVSADAARELTALGYTNVRTMRATNKSGRLRAFHSSATTDSFARTAAIAQVGGRHEHCEDRRP